MGWREDVKFGIGRISRLFVGTANGLLGEEVSLNQIKGGWDSITLTSETGASGSCAVQIVFNGPDGDPVAVPVTGDFYLSEVATGLTMDPADTGIAVLTNGGLFELDAAHKGWKFVSTAAGLLGFTITAAADSYWAVFKKASGELEIVGPLVVDA